MKILIRMPNWLGDIVMAVPAVKSVRASFPKARVDLLAPSWAGPIVEKSGILDEFLPMATKNLPSSVTASRALRERGYDLGILLTNSFSSAFSMRLTGAKRRLGYATDGRGFLLTDRVEMPDRKNERHQVFYYLELARCAERLLGLDPADATVPDTSISFPDTAVVDADKFLLNLGVVPGRPIVTLGVGSANSRAKRWPAANFAALADRLQQELGAVVLMVGSGSDHAAGAAVAASAKKPPLDLTGQTDISRAAGILKRSTAVVSNDMGLAHLSAAVGTPTFVVFGPTDPAATRPFSDLAHVITVGVECSPCMLRECPIDHRCMTWVSPDKVLEEVRKALVPA
jgi:heptosyltransferase II